MAQGGRVSFDEHRVNQVKRIFKLRRKNRIKKRVKLVIVAVVVLLFAGYLFSDFSKVGTIYIEGNTDVKSSDILKVVPVSDSDFHFLVDTQEIEDVIKELPLIKKVSVRKTFSGDIYIDVEETDKVAYGVIDGSIYLIDELGKISKTTDENVINELKFTPQFVDFKSVEFLETFAAEYMKLPDLIKTQTSDIVYDPTSSDTTRLKFIMVNGKILYLRVEDMASQLNSIDYEAMMTEYKDRCIFSFEGKHIYTKECD